MQPQRAAKTTTGLRKSSTGYCRALCCTNCRVSVSSSTTEGESASSSDRYASISSLSHYMVQERLDQMIKESEEERARKLVEARKGKQKRVLKNAVNSSNSNSNTNSRRLVMMVAMEKCTSDPREDFRQSMVEVILANRIEKPKDLRYLLNCYLSVNSEEHRSAILGAFHQGDHVHFSALSFLVSGGCY